MFILMKKLLLLIASAFCVVLSLNGAFAQKIELGVEPERYNFPYGEAPISSEWPQMGATENLPYIMANSVVNADGTLLDGLLRMFGFDTPEYEGIPKAIIYVRMIINLLLSLISFVALVIIIYSFYQMFFQEDAKGMEQVKKNLKGVAIALVILGFSWIIVSFIFSFYQDRLQNAL